MAGASFAVTLDDRDLQQLFARLIDDGSDLEPVMRDIGEHLLESTQQRFKDQVDPEGTAWEPLSELTLSRKEKNTDKILIGEGNLMGLLVVAASSDAVEIGSNLEYAAMHQFGGTTAANSMFPGKEIPARPFLGVSTSDDAAIIKLLQAHLDG